VKTQVLPISAENLRSAAELIRQGELVAFPTETVYGLGANALDASAVAKIFQAKGRPSDNPLIVHIASYDQLKALVSEIPQAAQLLIDEFWPGPLTLVFPKNTLVPDIVTAGGDTVAIRWPAHTVAQELITRAGMPIAAPSANLSGKPSPTLAKHVLEDLNERIPLILDAGATTIGLESTVLDITGEQLILLRAGGVSREELEKVLEREVIEKTDTGELARSPGMKYRHYAPQAQIVLFEKDLPTPPSEQRSALITLHEVNGHMFENSIHFSGSKEQMAHEIFEKLRALDAQDVEIIYIQKVESSGLGQAIMDRLNRAAEK
jgi:L-threonylcarbamoyladenylate synthase